MTQRPLAARVYAGGALAAFCATVVVSTMPVSAVWLVPLAAAMVYFFSQAYLHQIEDERRKAQQLAGLHLATIEALARAIDAKDRTTPDHIRRVQAYAAGLARALGMSEGEVQGVETAALLHDIGKLAVPEHILAKPGPLGPEELRKIRLHPEVGAEIIKSVPFPYPVAPIILYHHERWDGRGYPAGLKEDEIPLGARVVCTVDFFDALTSDRPYRPAIGHEAAVTLLRQEAGKALDPRVVDVFVDILPRLTAALTPIAPQPPPTSTSKPRPQIGDGVRAFGVRPPEGAQTSVFDDIALAHREIYALYEIAQAMGTRLGLSETMSLIASKLSHLVPFSACALFLHSDSTSQLHNRFATGTDSELLQQLALKSGHGLNGWVARNRRPVVNGRPSADLEAMGSNAPTVLQSALVCPLIFGERLIGTLAVYHTEPGFYREDHRRLLDRVCEQAAAVIHNSIVFEQTQEDSLTDPLTGLPNTRSMLHHLTRELARASRLKSQVALAVLDLNDFKDINDTYGHQVGDAALREVAAVLRAAIRPYDMCVRYAGDEFIVVLSGCGLEEAESKRLELQAAVAGIGIDVRPGERMSLSISAGAAVFPHDGDTYEALLGKADSRMYADKTARKTHLSRGAVVAAAADASEGAAVGPRG